jgi:hypothetical protein
VCSSGARLATRVSRTGIEDVDKDVKMEYVRGCRHAMLMYPRIIWI